MADGEVAPEALDQHVEAVPEEPPPPPPPLEPLLEVPTPRVLAVRSDSAQVEWQQAGMTVPASEDPRQLEVQQLFTYSVPHELQMQEVAVSGPASGDALMQQALSMIVEKGWMKVLEAPCCNAEVRANCYGALCRGACARRRVIRRPAGCHF
jgi:hypothetical protein